MSKVNMMYRPCSPSFPHGSTIRVHKVSYSLPFLTRGLTSDLELLTNLEDDLTGNLVPREVDLLPVRDHHVQRPLPHPRVT